MKSIKGKYLAEVFNKGGFYFLKLLYKIDSNKTENVEFYNILENNNSLRIIFGDYIIAMTNYNKNKDLIENNKLLIVKLPDLQDESFYKLAKGYVEYDSNSSKYAVYLNNLKIEKINTEKIYQVIDGNSLIYDFKEFKHNKKNRILHCDNPLSERIYIRFGNYLYGYLTWKENKTGIEITCLNTSNKVDKIEINTVMENRIFINDYSGFDEYELINLNTSYNKIDEEDFIEYSLLTSQFVNSLTTEQIKNFSIHKKQLKETLSDIPRLSKYRKDLVYDMINEQNFFIETIDMIIDNIYNDEDRLEKICKEIAERHSEVIEGKLEEYSSEINTKKKELELINNNIKDANDKLYKINNDRQSQLEIQNKDKLQNLKKEIDNETKEIKGLIDKKEQLNKDIEELIAIHGLAKDVEQIRHVITYLNRDKQNLEKQIEDIKYEKRKIEDECKALSDRGSKAYKQILDEASDKIKEHYEKSQFENYSINKMLEITSTCDNIISNEEIKNQIKDRNYVAMDLDDRSDIVNKIQRYINDKGGRNISFDDVANIMICISQGFLTILAGEPGTGKTSLCNILAKSMGLCAREPNSRFLQVSVEKGWTSKSDFIGYFNPLTKRFDSANRKVYEALKILNLEENMRKNNIDNNINEVIEYPYLMLLDEANLSPMEHYWADFMNACDIYDEDRYITLSENDFFNISQSFRFLATINYDHTTEVLSPRLIDRAWILLLDGEEVDINNLTNSKVENNKNIILYDDMKKFMNSQNNQIPIKLENKLKDIVLKFRTNGVNISPRVLKMIKDYCAIGYTLFQSNNHLTCLDYAVSQKILPMIDGFGNEYKHFLEELRENELSGMKKSQKIINTILCKGDKNMKHYQFFGI